MVDSLRARTESQFHKMNPVGMDDCERLSTALRVCTRVCRVVPKLENMTGLTERALLKIGTVPFLWA